MILLTSPLFAQVSIDLPVNKSVFQRNNAHQANISIAGHYNQGVISSVQARLVAPNTSNAISGFDWTIIDASPSKGQYFGQLSSVPAGWYTLEVQILKSGSSLANTSVSRVGVGDVYLAFGQSNAQGIASNGQVGAVSEKVISHNFIDPCSQEIPPFPNLTQIGAASNLGQHGQGAWFYGRLGDNLVTAKGVPVAIFNAGSAGAAVHNFVQSASGSPTTNFFTGSQFCQGINPQFSNGIGTPYLTFLKTINYYNSLYGIRAILWSQGETDTYINTTQGNYAANLQALIDKTRQDFGSTIPWVIAKSSFYRDSTSANVINGQISVMNPATQVFDGPTTDYINLGNLGAGHRDDLEHFNDAGLLLVADRWSDILTANIYNSNSSSFYDISSPISAENYPEVSVNIVGNNITFTAPSGYSSYKWVAGNDYENPSQGSGQSLTKSSGSYRCYMADAHGNLVVSQVLDVTAILLQQTIPTSCTGEIYLSDYTPYNVQNGFGPIEYDQSVGSDGDGDGSTLTMNGVTFNKGLGVHANSTIEYRLPSGIYNGLRAKIGIDDEIGNNGSVIFKIYGDGSLIYTSPTLTGAGGFEEICVSIGSYSILKLEVDGTGDGVSYDHADWADIKLMCDATAPNTPLNLTMNKVSSKCLGIQWSASPMNEGVVAYEIYKDNVLISSLDSSVLNYQFEGLLRSTSYTLGVKAVDCYGNKSIVADTSISTTAFSVQFSSNDQICIGESIVPITFPSGGTFEMLQDVNDIATLNTATGEIIFNAEGFVLINYKVEIGTACEESLSKYVGAHPKPSPPNISINTNQLVNIGNLSTLISSACSSPYLLEWSYQNGDTTTYDINLSDSTTFYARCNNSNCYSDNSNPITIKVIPDCPDSFNLAKLTDDLNYGNASFNFLASQVINADNKIYAPSGATFTAGQIIELNPGFEIEAGSVFSASIQGCP